MRRFTILHPSGRIAGLVIKRLLSEDRFADVQLTLLAEMPEKLAELQGNGRVTIVSGSSQDYEAVLTATKDADLVFLAKVDDRKFTPTTKNLVKASKENGFGRVIALSLAGLYYEIPGEFGCWVDEMVGSGRFLPAREAGQRLEQSGLNYTLIRMPALTNWPDVKYVTTERGETFEGVSVSRSSVADLVLKAMADPSFAAFASVGIVQPETTGYTRPVY